MDISSLRMKNSILSNLSSDATYSLGVQSGKSTNPVSHLSHKSPEILSLQLEHFPSASQ